jgi:hypothetical protein
VISARRMSGATYNALYYPYVLGLRLYSFNGLSDRMDAETRAVVEWFRAGVPERTLHNWQNAASRLVALDLREKLPENGSDWQSFA